jgi:hypothetical protein
MSLTAKQMEVLLLVSKKNEDESFVDLDQILERVTYTTNKPSMQFIIRNLIEDKKLIQKEGFVVRRDRKRVVFRTTVLGDKYVEWNTPKEKSLKEALTAD